MTNRQLRRAQQQKARSASASANTPESHLSISEAQLDANRANAQQSTGPRTEQGKVISSLNNFRHGFRSKFTVLPAEDQHEFEAVLSSLRAEHSPPTPTEEILIDKLAEHFWLSRRAQLLQDMALGSGDPRAEQERSLTLYLRYQTTNDRAFSKCLHDLLKLRSEKRQAELAVLKQQHNEADQIRKQEVHAARVRMVSANAARQELDTDIKGTVQALLPGHTPIPFDILKHILSNAIEEAVRESDANPKLFKAA